MARASFLTKLPEGSRVAVVGFSSEVERLCPFTTDRDRVLGAVNRLRPGGSTRFYDAVSEALVLLDEQTGRRAVLAPTDGEDTASESASLDTTIAAARRLGLPVYTLGLGTEEEIASADLRRLATATRTSTTPPATPTTSEQFTRPSLPESAPATHSFTRAIAVFPTARFVRCESSIAAAAKPARPQCSSPAWSSPRAAGRPCSSPCSPCSRPWRWFPRG